MSLQNGCLTKSDYLSRQSLSSNSAHNSFRLESGIILTSQLTEAFKERG